MYKEKKILAIIPARGGSKGLEKKNIKPLNGKPLITWTIEKAQNSKLIDTIIVSTDCKEIADVARKSLVEVPFLRPSKLAQDSSPTYEAVLHVVSELEKNDLFFDYLILLEPTSPMRKKNDIDEAIKKLIDNENMDSLISVGEVHTEHPQVVKKINSQGLVEPYVENKSKIHQRQQADEAYFPYGVIYACKVDSYKSEKSFYLENTIPFLIERWQCFEIDDLIDFQITELINSKNN